MFIDHIILLQHDIKKILNLINFLEIMVTAVVVVVMRRVRGYLLRRVASQTLGYSRDLC